MRSGTTETGMEEFSTLLDELYATAKINDDIKRQFTMIRLSSHAKERYGIEAEAYLELHKKYQEGVRHFVDIRSLGNILYKGLLSASALAAAIGTLNIFSFVADQRGKSIAANWNTLKLYSGDIIDGGRKSAIESLVVFGEVLDRVDFSKSPLTRLDIRPSCKLFGHIPSGTFGISWKQKDLSGEKAECPMAQMQNAKFNGAWIYEADMSLANLSEAEFNGARAQGIILSRANLAKAKLIKADLSQSKARKSDLTHANLTDADLRGANLSGADLQGVELCRTKIQVTGDEANRTIGYEPLKGMKAACKDSADNFINGKPLLIY